MNETTQIDLKEIFMALVRRWWILLICTLVVGGGVYLYTANFVTPMYRASTRLYVNNTKNPTQTNSQISAADLATSERLVTTYIAILQSDTSLEKVAKEANVNYTASAIRSMMSAASVNETEVFDIAICHPDPKTAMNIANAVATVAKSEISYIVEGSSTKIIDQAKEPKAPYSPNKMRSALIGAAVGLLLAAVAIAVRVILDVRIKGEEDLARLSDAPVLGRIPDFDQEKGDTYAYVPDNSGRRKAVK